MKAWLSRTQLRQRPMLAVYAGLLILIAVVIGAASLSWLTSRNDDRLAVIGNLLSFGTLLLALVAGIVALAAYSAATGLPNLKLKFILDAGYPNRAAFGFYVAGGAENNPVIQPFYASIIIQNTSTYAARTPAVIIELQGTSIDQERWRGGPDWIEAVRDQVKGEISAFQWDGGPNYAIHGDSARYLPEIDLSGIRPRNSARMIIRLLADGYNRAAITIPIEFVQSQSKSQYAYWRPPILEKPPPEWL